MSPDDEPLALIGTMLGTSFDGAASATPGAVIVEAGRIAEVVADPDDRRLPPRRLQAAYVAPGFVDL